jgi:hypothetical protein
MGTSVSALKQEVFAELGGGTGGFVTVELTDEAFNNAVKMAKRWFNSKKGYSVFRPVPIVDGQLEYKMTVDVQQVLDVVFQIPSDVAAFFTLGFFDIIPYGPNTLLSVGSGLTNYSGFAQLLEFTEKRKRVFSVEPEWYYEQQTQILHITARGGTPSGVMLVQLKTSNFDPANLNDKDDDMFVRWVKAKCKEIVGRVRSKYDTLPGAGGPVAMDGQRLIDESKEEFEKLNQEIFWSQGPDMTVIG